MLDTLLRAHAPILQTAPAATRGRLIRELATRAGVSLQTAYRHLDGVVDSGRKRRADHGESDLPEEVLVRASTMMAQARNKRGRCSLSMKEVWRILSAEGEMPVGYQHFVRCMNRHGLGRRHLTAAEPSITRVSRYPNHVWQIDISICAQWYLDDSGSLRQRLHAERELYIGKRENIAGLRQVIYRYLVVDHYSGAYFCRYYLAAGENAADMVDFLYHAMAAKRAHPLHGIPYRIVWDQGPANRAQEVRILLQSLGLEKDAEGRDRVEYHKPGNAKATGAVETRHNHWQNAFEGRLSQERATSIEELNRWAEASATEYCLARPLERNGTSAAPATRWAEITEGQLREPPPRDVFFSLAASKERTATLNQALWIRADGERWQASGPNLHPGQKVKFRLHPYLPQGLRAWDEHGRELTVLKLTFDKAGFPEQGRIHVWDEPAHKGATVPAPAAQRLARAVDEGAETVVSTAELYPDLDRMEERARFLRRTGTEFERTVTEAPLSFLDALDRVVAELGRRPTDSEVAWWEERIGDGITPSGLDTLWKEWRAAPAAALQLA